MPWISPEIPEFHALILKMIPAKIYYMIYICQAQFKFLTDIISFNLKYNSRRQILLFLHVGDMLHQEDIKLEVENLGAPASLSCPSALSPSLQISLPHPAGTLKSWVGVWTSQKVSLILLLLVKFRQRREWQRGPSVHSFLWFPPCKMVASKRPYSIKGYNC